MKSFKPCANTERDKMKETTVGAVTIICFTILIISVLGEPDLIDAAVHMMMK